MREVRRANEILDYFQDWQLDAESVDFLRYHYRRFEFLLWTLDPLIKELEAQRHGLPLRILDIGPGFETELLRHNLPRAVVSTAGFGDARFTPRPQDAHIEFDLNDAQSPERWPVTERYDLVIMAEVLEHLHTAPTLVLGCVVTWSRAGGWLVLQTPNACALHKRLGMLAGRNPYDMVCETAHNPGHFREYTIAELRMYAGLVGLSVVGVAAHNYFDSGSYLHRAYNMVSPLLPRNLRQGLTLTLRKESS